MAKVRYGACWRWIASQSIIGVLVAQTILSAVTLSSPR